MTPARLAQPFNRLVLACLLASGLALPARALAGSAPSPSEAGDQVRSWKELKRFGLGNVNAISSSPDGSKIAVATGLGIVIRTAADQQIERILSGHTARVISVAWSPDGTRIASGAFDSKVKIWDARSGALLLTVDGPANPRRTSPAAALSWSPDGSRLAGGGILAHVPVAVWDVATGAVVRTLSCRPHPVFSFCIARAVAWSPDGSRIAASSAFVPTPPRLGGTFFRGVVVWDAASGTLLRTIVADRFVSSLAWSPDGAKLAGGSGLQDFSPGRIVEIWNPSSGALLATLKGHTGGVNGVAWSSDGARIVTASDDWTLRIWDAAAGTTLKTLRGHTRAVFSVSLSSGGRLASASRDQSIKIWDLATGGLVNTLSGHTLISESVSWSPDRSRIASAYFDRTVRIWDVRTGAVVRTLRGHTNLVSAVAWSPDGSRVASASYDGRIKLWDARSGRLIQNLLGHSRYVTSVAWSADGSRLASGSGDSTVKIWDAGKGSLIRTLAGDQVVTSSVSWSSDGTRIAAGDLIAAAINIWDVESGHLKATLQGHLSFIESVAWSPDGTRLASAALDSNLNSQVKIWDAANGALVRTLRRPGGFLSVSWSPDGSKLATGSADRSIGIWDAITGKLKKSLLGHRDWVTSVSWSADGRSLASGSFDGTVRVWGGSDAGDGPEMESADEVAASPAFDPDERESEEAAGRRRSSDDGDASPRGVSFSSRGEFPVGDSPVALAVGDFNGDGIPDVATANALSHDVSILLGGKDGSFHTVPQSFGAGLIPQGIAAGDFNGDGVPDVVVAQFGNSISVMLGNGDGTFQPAQEYQAGCCSPSSVEVGDFDGDGIQDLAVTMANQSSVAIFIGKGDGTFTFLKSFPVGFGPRKVIAGDFNGDGIPDLAVPVFNSFVSFGPDAVAVLLGNGDGTFRAAGKVALGAFAAPWSVTAGDFDGDGIIDLALPNASANSVSVLLGRGDGTFQPAKTYPAGSVPFSIVTAAFSRQTRPDGGAVLDLATANAGSAFDITTAGSLAAISILQGNGDGTFQPAQGVQAGTGPSAVAVGDFNGDRVPDLATANGFSNDVSILINTTPSPE